MADLTGSRDGEIPLGQFDSIRHTLIIESVDQFGVHPVAEGVGFAFELVDDGVLA